MPPYSNINKKEGKGNWGDHKGKKPKFIYTTLHTVGCCASDDAYRAYDNYDNLHDPS